MPFGRPEGSIKKRVMAVIESRIRDAETKFEEGCDKFDDEFAADVRTAAAVRDNNKEKLGEELVGTIIGKIL